MNVDTRNYLTIPHYKAEPVESHRIENHLLVAGNNTSSSSSSNNSKSQSHTDNSLGAGLVVMDLTSKRLNGEKRHLLDTEMVKIKR